MAAYFQLISKQTGLPTSFSAIDVQLCTNFFQPVHPTAYLAGWYDCIGFRVATGKTLSEIWDIFEGYIEEENKEGREYYRFMQSILSFIMEYYTTDSWFGR